MNPRRGNSSPWCHSTLATTRRGLSQLFAWYLKLAYRTIGFCYINAQIQTIAIVVVWMLSKVFAVWSMAILIAPLVGLGWGTYFQCRTLWVMERRLSDNSK